MEKITECWNEVSFEELEEKLELETCDKNYCAPSYMNNVCSSVFCGSNYVS